MRTADIERITKETRISLSLNLDGGDVSVETGLGFFDHMLTALFFYAGFGARLTASGDLDVDARERPTDGAQLRRTPFAGIGGRPSDNLTAEFGLAVRIQHEYPEPVAEPGRVDGG